MTGMKHPEDEMSSEQNTGDETSGPINVNVIRNLNLCTNFRTSNVFL